MMILIFYFNKWYIIDVDIIEDIINQDIEDLEDIEDIENIEKSNEIIYFYFNK